MKQVLNLTNKNNERKKNKRKRMVGLCLFLGILIVAAIGLTVYGQFSNSHNKLSPNQTESVLDIFQTEFGEKYETELKNMKGVAFYSKTDDKSGMTVLKVKSSDSIDENIILMHMVYTNINQILPEADDEKVHIIAYDAEGTFFDTTEEKFEFIQAFCREEYIMAVEKKEKLLYNFPVRTQ